VDEGTVGKIKEMSENLQQRWDLLKSVLLTSQLNCSSMRMRTGLASMTTRIFFSLEVGLFCWKHKAATEHFSVTSFFRKGLFICRY